MSVQMTSLSYLGKMEREATPKLGLKGYIGFTKKHEGEKHLRYRDSVQKMLYFLKSIEYFRNEGASTANVSVVHMVKDNT